MTTTRDDLRAKVAQLIQQHDADQESVEVLAALIVGITTGTGCQADDFLGEHRFDDRADAGTYEVCGKPATHRDHGVGLPVHSWSVSIDTLVREGLRPGDQYVDDDYDEIQIFDPRRFWVGGEIPAALLRATSGGRGEIQ